VKRKEGVSLGKGRSKLLEPSCRGGICHCSFSTSKKTDEIVVGPNWQSIGYSVGENGIFIASDASPCL